MKADQLKQPDLPALPIEEYLSPKEVAGEFGLQSFSAYRWIAEGTIPQKYVRYCGMWRMRIHPDVLPVLKEKFAAAHGS